MWGLRTVIAVGALGALATTALVASRPPALAFEHIANGSFEDGDAGWTAQNATLASVEPIDIVAADGTRVALVAAAGGPFALTQQIHGTLGPGAYSVRARVHLDGAATDVRTVVALASADAFVQSAPVSGTAPGEWATIDTEFTVAGYTTAAISIRGTANASDSIYVDGVALDGAPPVTPPATATATAASTPGALSLATATKTATTTKTATATRTATALPLATPTPAPAAGLLANGGFEDVGDDGAPLAWQRYGGALTSAGSPVHGGARAAVLESATDSTKWLYEVVAIDGSQAYEFSAWVLHNDPAVSAALLRVSWYASSDGSGTAIAATDSTERLDAPATDYRQLTTGAVLAPAGAASARVRVLLAPASAMPSRIFVDDAAFVRAAAAPTGSAALALASGGSDRSGVAADSGHVRTGEAVAPGSSEPAGARVVINEVLYDAVGDGEDAANEWVELFNAGDVALDLEGWTLGDAAGADPLPSLELAPHRFAIVAASDSFTSGYPAYRGALAAIGGRIGNGLGNDGDRLTLADASGEVRDQISWGNDSSALDPAIGDVPAGHSIERRAAGSDSDAAADFIDNDSPSPGAAYSSRVDGRGAVGTGRGANVLIRRGSGATPWWVWTAVGGAAAALAFTAGSRLAPTLRARLTRL